jgi:membrane protease YdiL (CAAX protease family)
METDRGLSVGPPSRRRFVALVIGGLIGAFVEIPHLLANFAQFLGAGLLVAIATAVGTSIAPRVGLGTPVLDAALGRRPLIRAAWSVAVVSIVSGLLVALTLVALETAVFTRLASGVSATPPPVWTGALAALYGGLTEEIVLRYGIMSLGVWFASRLLRGAQAYWAAILIAAVVFALWHLWFVAAAVAVTPTSIARIVLLNALAGTVFGWLYWRRGLEAAMVSHGTAALIVHVAVPSIGM